MEYKKRQTAHKIKIKDLVEGQFVKDNESLNLLKTSQGIVSRVNVLGFIVAEEASDYYGGAVIDDGTGRISIRSFENKNVTEGFNVGDAINVIGRVRIYGEQKYISIEIIKGVDKSWIEHRKKELVMLENIYKKNNEEVATSGSDVAEAEFVESDSDKVVKAIRSLDSGNGVSIQEVVKKSEVSECEKIIDDLLKSGDIFEIQPGKIKMLE